MQNVTPPACSHMTVIWVLGNLFELTISCKAAHNHMIFVCNHLCQPSQKINGKLAEKVANCCQLPREFPLISGALLKEFPANPGLLRSRQPKAKQAHLLKSFSPCLCEFSTKEVREGSQGLCMPEFPSPNPSPLCLHALLLLKFHLMGGNLHFLPITERS